MSDWNGYEHNDTASFIGQIIEASELQDDMRTHRLIVQDKDGHDLKTTIWKVSPAVKISWQEKQWYNFQNILVKQWDSSTELHVTEKTTVELANSSPEVLDESTQSQSDASLARCKLSELYEAFRSLNYVIKIVLEDESTSFSEKDFDEPLVHYHFVIESILFDNEYLPSGLNGYGAQQRDRIQFGINEYREQYGSGNWITEYDCIDIQPFKQPIREQLIKHGSIRNESALVRPVAPQSEQSLPDFVTSSQELETAFRLLSEFPAIPTGPTDKTPSEKQLPVRQIYMNLIDEIDDQALLDPEAIPAGDTFDDSQNSDIREEEHSISETLTWLHEESSHSSEIADEKSQDSRDALFEDKIPLADPVVEAVRNLDISSLYVHQKKALEATKTGENVVLSTETASGKSLPYRLLSLDRAYRDEATTLYIAPTKALINDQAADFEKFIEALPENSGVSVGIYTGDTTKKERREIKYDPPNVLLMTPELVHRSLLPYHSSWSSFLQHLETIVIDEVHEFRGLFGSHIGLLFRRLNRLLDRYNQEPSYFCCSATIGNPKIHASSVTGRQSNNFSLVDEDTSGRGRRSWLFYNPPLKERNGGIEDSDINDYPDNWDELSQRVRKRDEHQCTSCGKLGGMNGSAELHAHHIVSPSQGGKHSLPNLKTLCSECHSDEHGRPVGREVQPGDSQERPNAPGEVEAGYERRSNHPISIRLFTEIIARGHQTLVFTRTRQGTEQYAKESAKRLEQMGYHELTNQIKAYNARQEDAERESIERGLKNGEIKGVWSTNALELGVDIGSLDAVIIDGHPGTNMSLFQQTGRGGRGQEDCVILFVAQPNPLDQYWINNIDRVFDDPPADAKINTNNKVLVPDHIVSAADEYPLSVDDRSHFGEQIEDLVPALSESGRLTRSIGANGVQWDSTESDTQHSFPLRGEIGAEYTLIDQTRDETIGSIEFPDVLRDCHPKAIYTYHKRNYRVEKFDETHCRVHLSEIPDSKQFTRPIFNQSVSVQVPHDRKQIASENEANVAHAELSYEESLEGYLQYSYPGDNDPIENTIDKQLPSNRIQTSGLYLTIPSRVEDRMQNMVDSEEGVIAGIHAIEHAMQSMFPLEVLCSTNDIRGVSVSQHQHTGLPTIFILDNIEGGAGLTQSGYDEIMPLLRKAKSVIASCDCQFGCPSCIYLDSCRSQNRVLNKELALYTLSELVEN